MKETRDTSIRPIITQLSLMAMVIMLYFFIVKDVYWFFLPEKQQLTYRGSVSDVFIDTKFTRLAWRLPLPMGYEKDLYFRVKGKVSCEIDFLSFPKHSAKLDELVVSLSNAKEVTVWLKNGDSSPLKIVVDGKVVYTKWNALWGNAELLVLFLSFCGWCIWSVTDYALRFARQFVINKN